MSELYRQSKLTEEEMDYYVFPHVMAMTSEELHYKAQIAKELGARDKKIKELESELVKSTAWGVYHFTSEELAIRDLEQRIISIENLKENINTFRAFPTTKSIARDCYTVEEVDWFLSTLRNQAKGGDL